MRPPCVKNISRADWPYPLAVCCPICELSLVLSCPSTTTSHWISIAELSLAGERDQPLDPVFPSRQRFSRRVSQTWIPSTVLRVQRSSRFPPFSKAPLRTPPPRFSPPVSPAGRRRGRQGAPPVRHGRRLSCLPTRIRVFSYLPYFPTYGLACSLPSFLPSHGRLRSRMHFVPAHSRARRARRALPSSQAAAPSAAASPSPQHTIAPTTARSSSPSATFRPSSLRPSPSAAPAPHSAASR